MRRFVRTWLSLVAVGAGCLVLSAEAGCVKRKSGLSDIEKEQVKQYVLDKLPDDAHKVDVNYDDKVHLIGWKSTPEAAKKGEKIHLVLYWQRTGDLDPGWMLFTHITADSTKDARGNADCQGDIRVPKGGAGECTTQLFGPSEWEKGKVIADPFDFAVPADGAWTPAFRFLVGVWKGNDRLHILNAEASDGDNRAIVVRVPTNEPAPEEAPKKTEVPLLNAPKFGANDVKIDGKLDDAGWQKAGFTGPFVDPGDGSGAPPDHPVNATAKVGWDDENLYVGFAVQDKDPTSPFKPTDVDPHIWEKSSAVEIMLQPGDLGDNKDYYEMQVDTANAVFDTHWDDYNVPKDDAKGSFGHMEWSSGMKKAVAINAGVGYTIEIAIPWKSFDRPRVAAPPHPGDVWRADFYSFRDGQSKSLAWAPILRKGNFHFSARFGKIAFLGPALPPGAASGLPSNVPPAGASAPPSNLGKPVPMVPIKPPMPSRTGDPAPNF